MTAFRSPVNPLVSLTAAESVADATQDRLKPVRIWLYVIALMVLAMVVVACSPHAIAIGAVLVGAFLIWRADGHPGPPVAN